MRIPLRLAAPLRIAHAESGVAVELTLMGARDARAGFGDGIAVYEGAGPDDADVLLRPTGAGLEDYLLFEQRPASEQVDYLLSVGEAAGLRLVSNVLELVDTSGTPRLRMAPPYVIDADGVRHAASVELAGCRVDRDPSAPWERTPVPPGNAVCSLRVSWSPVSYPALVDPTWELTGTTVAERNGDHTATRLDDGRVLVVGGAIAELYDPATGTFAATGTPNTARTHHTATLLSDGRVLITGGNDGGGDLSSAELYSGGTFTAAAGAMRAPRADHTATELGSGEVLVALGTSSGNGTVSYDLYDPTTDAFSLLPGLSQLDVARPGGTATLLGGDRVLLAGGRDEIQQTSRTSGTIFDRNGSPALTRAKNPMTVGMSEHQAVRLRSGQVLLAGSTSSRDTSLFDPVAESFLPGPTMNEARSGFVLQVLLGGQVLAAAGYGPKASAEILDTAATAWTPVASMQTARGSPTSTLLDSGSVLVIGGFESPTTAEVFSLLPSGSPCPVNEGECASGVCSDGVCCDRTCEGQCEACDVAGSEGTCTPVVGDPHGARAPCVGTGECRGTCDGNDTAGCSFPDVTTPCGTSSCASGMVTEQTCDGAGECGGASERSCEPYICVDSERCGTSCSRDEECAAGFACGPSGTCEPSGSRCEGNSVVDTQGITTSCDPYRCVGTACLQQCTTSDDCVASHVCSNDKCIPASSDKASEEDGCGCRVPARPARRTAWLLALAALVLAVVRRRHGR